MNFGALAGRTGSRAGTAWQISSSADEVVVAVIDSGVDVSHPDLSDVIWINSKRNSRKNALMMMEMAISMT